MARNVTWRLRFIKARRQMLARIDEAIQSHELGLIESDQALVERIGLITESFVDESAPLPEKGKVV